MKVDIQKLPKSRVEIVIEESAEKVASYRAEVLKEAQKNVQVKGFRKGAQIPTNVLEQHIGSEKLAQMTIEKAIEGIYRETLQKEKLMPVGQASITEVVSQNPLVVKLELEIFPELEMQDSYKTVKLEKTDISVSEEEVDAALEDIQKRFTHFHAAPEDAKAIMGDKVVIDTDGYDDQDKILESTSMRAYPLELGSHILVPGFEEDIVGMKAGEEKMIDVVFPAEYHNVDFAGKTLKFRVKVYAIENAHVPEFTKEFIKDLRGKDLDLAGFRALIQEEIRETKESNDQMQKEMKLIDALLAHAKLDIGDTLLAEQTQRVFEEISQNIARDGLKVADYIASLGLDEETYKKNHVEEIAKKRLQGEIILSHLVEKNNFTISDELLEQEVQKIMSRFDSQDVLDKIKELYVPGNKYYEELRRRLVLREYINTFFS